MGQQQSEASLSEVHGSIDVTKSQKGWRRMLAYLGPAYLVSVGYMDPGNWATDLAGGARFGYSLLWVLLMSNLMALLLQGLSARLGIVRRMDLAQANREVYPRVVNFALYILAELAIAACDLAEVLGMAIGIQLLTGLPLIWGVSITVLDTFLLFYLQRLGMRKMEGFIIALVAIIGFSFLIQMIIAKPQLGLVIKGFIPSIPGGDALYIAIGIIGATVMPHNLYLHSALVQTRKIGNSKPAIKQALRYNRIDSTIALNAAFFVNAAILILAASVFHASGNTDIAELKEAHRMLAPLLGNTLAPTLFAIALIAAGQSSTITGTLAGQIVMEGYLNLRINPMIRRLITRLLAIIPAFFCILYFGEERIDRLLILSQVVLSVQLGFAVIPLIHFVSDKETMGDFVIKWPIKILAWLIATVLIYLNVRMVVNELSAAITNDLNIVWLILIIIAAIFFIALFILMTTLPLIKKRKKTETARMHMNAGVLQKFTIPQLNCIAVALDFSKNDENLIANALSQGNTTTRFLLLHIVESPSARAFGENSDDFETRKDRQHLQSYVEQLQKKGFLVEGKLGYRHRTKEIVRIVKEANADMLVMGAHFHTGVFDYLYGETVDKVRHQLRIPVLVVS
ncbi:Nramp family divalent metal transporter [Segetibacter sp.]|jgi:manganese transport protein|uniref:Nramp family divalent metal transporter n=1 Tax=Segetibacter sp. TaxID=2231182 RepID=UPI00261A3BBD|nr:Nramp family divalent metal transporter [Segetibacter sp.]MCW3079838.1 manganese transport protein MntH [Segetibacter sp.]